MAVQTRQFNQRFIGLSTRVGKKDPFHPRQLTETLSQLLLHGDAVQIRGVQQRTRLFADYRRYLRVCMTQARHPNAAQRIQITSSLIVPQPRAFAPSKRDIQSCVGIH